MRTGLLSLGLLGTLVVASGCSGSSPQTERIAIGRASLNHAASCGELEQMVKADAMFKMNRVIDAEIADIRRWGMNVGYGTANSAGAPQAGGAKDSGSSHASSHSDTNTQVAGVDEADIVKTDGKYVYLLHGNALEIIDAWPAPALAVSSSTAIEGDPIEMYVTGNQAVVYSTVDGAPIYAAAGLAPRDPYSDWYGYGMYGGGGAPARAGGGADMAYPEWYGGWGYWYQHPLTKITVLSLNGAQASVARELYFEGFYQSSRRMDSKVRTVLMGGAHGPQILYWPQYNSSGSYPQTTSEWVAALEQVRQQNAATIQASSVTDWLPYAMIKTSGGVQAQTIACEDYYMPTQGTTVFGLTQIQSIDLGAPADPPHGASVMAETTTIYANENTMYLATQSWEDPWDWLGYGWGYQDATPSTPISLTHTHVHQFDLVSDPTTPKYVASGTVQGRVQNQFWMDAQNGVLRVATTDELWGKNAGPNGANWTTDNHVFALQPNGDSLDIVGDAGDIAPGETIFATRFVGSRGYLSVYRQVDPLFVLDLSNPQSLSVLGSLTIAGFSNYMQPIDDTHLLTIGEDAPQNPNVAHTLALSIFDVSNPMAPKRTALFDFDGYQYGWSDATYNHKAFTWFPERKLLTFPFYAYQQNLGMKSTAEAFTVDVTAGITHLGSVDHTALFGQSVQGYCGGYFDPWVRRGVFLDDVLVSISYAGVISSNTKDMTQPPLATLKLPAPVVGGYPGCR